MAHDAVLAGDPSTRSGHGPSADRVPDVAPRVPVGHDAVARAGAVPGVRGRQGHGALAGTGEFTQRTQKRYDDTVLLLAEILEHGYDSERGKAALRRMNQMHGRYSIPNDEFLYVLSTFVFEPIRWNERFGWRPLLRQEKLASFYFWREIARRMAIKDVPEDYETLERYYDEFARPELSVRAGEPCPGGRDARPVPRLVPAEAALAAWPAVHPRDDGRPPPRRRRPAAAAPGHPTGRGGCRAAPEPDRPPAPSAPEAAPDHPTAPPDLSERLHDRGARRPLTYGPVVARRALAPAPRVPQRVGRAGPMVDALRIDAL